MIHPAEADSAAEPPLVVTSLPARQALARILVVTSDELWGRQVGTMLEGDWFVVETEPSAAAVVDHVRSFRPDLVGVDLSLAGVDPRRLFEAVRLRSAATVVAFGVTGVEAAVVSALAAGADTFIPKSAPPRELLARLRALLRRFPPVESVHGERAGTASVELDPAGREVRVGGERVTLTDAELRLLAALLASPGRVVPPAELMVASGASTRGALDLQVRWLREKLEAKDPRRRIVAVRGVGFRFEDAGAEQI